MQFFVSSNKHAGCADVFCADDLGTIDDWENADKIIKVRPTYSELFQNKDSYMNIGPWLLSEETKRKLTEKDKSPDQMVAGVDVTGKEAIEELLIQKSAPSILHLATHGFFLNDLELSALSDTRLVKMASMKPVPSGKINVQSHLSFLLNS